MLFDIGEKVEKNLEFYIKTYKLLDLNFCNEVVKDIQNIEWYQHMFYNVRSDEHEKVSGEKELDIGYSDSDKKEIIMSKIWDAFLLYVNELNFPWWNSWQGFSNVRFNKYESGRLMAEHCDHIHTLFDGKNKGIPTMTALGLLNDDYKGGELVFFGDTVVPFNAGEIKIFPSCFLFPHRIETVTEGTRYSFVSWAW